MRRSPWLWADPYDVVRDVVTSQEPQLHHLGQPQRHSLFGQLGSFSWRTEVEDVVDSRRQEGETETAADSRLNTRLEHGVDLGRPQAPELAGAHPQLPVLTYPGSVVACSSSVGVGWESDNGKHVAVTLAMSGVQRNNLKNVVIGSAEDRVISTIDGDPKSEGVLRRRHAGLVPAGCGLVLELLPEAASSAASCGFRPIRTAVRFEMVVSLPLVELKLSWSCSFGGAGRNYTKSPKQ